MSSVTKHPCPVKHTHPRQCLRTHLTAEPSNQTPMPCQTHPRQCLRTQLIAYPMQSQNTQAMNTPAPQTWFPNSSNSWHPHRHKTALITYTLSSFPKWHARFNTRSVHYVSILSQTEQTNCKNRSKRFYNSIFNLRFRQKLHYISDYYFIIDLTRNNNVVIRYLWIHERVLHILGNVSLYK